MRYGILKDGYDGPILVRDFPTLEEALKYKETDLFGYEALLIQFEVLE
jgi:hypothetical protein